MNTNQYDGFIPRFVVATPKEVFIPLKSKMQPCFTLKNIMIYKYFNYREKDMFEDVKCMIKSKSIGNLISRSEMCIKKFIKSSC